MVKFISTVVALLVAGVAVTRTQEPSRKILSDVERAGIIESVLQLTARRPLSASYFRPVSSENIGFIKPSLLEKYGFKLVTPSAIDLSKQDNMVDYLVFRNIYLRGDAAVVVVAQVTEGRPCFGEYSFSEETSVYEARQTFDRWVAKLIRDRLPSFPSAWQRARQLRETQQTAEPKPKEQ